MKKINLEFNEQQVENLKVFLSRTDVKGLEVPAFVEIMNALNNPDKSEDNVED